MRAVLDQISLGLIIVAILHSLAMLYLDRVQLKTRLTSLLGPSGRKPVLWRGPGMERSLSLLVWPCVMLSWFGALSGAPDAHKHEPWTTRQTVYWALYTVCFFAFVVLVNLWRRRRWRTQKAFELSRGLLKDTARKLAAKSRAFWPKTPPVYLLPDPSSGKLYARLQLGVVLPLRLLDLLSCREIDSLVAQQLCLQAKQFYDPAFWRLFACDALFAAAILLLKLGPLYACLALLFVLIVQLYVLRRYASRILLGADLRAIELTGDADAFFSAMGALSRFHGTNLPDKTLAEIAREKSIPSDRIITLVAERVSPAEERYPTSGSYMETGF